ncbi:cupin domain-containing protein [Deinococcus maricopensis]|uniref:Cupin 2 conserved barrel domain protein n=1 Tax=Deinococcus maricopensis (strain DSM 21211 / LMG 22137 / NRRL B-23946 / LB-34) TaxID=709986 RepID=E8UBT6_DEIML|nr:cupin domain-containing protein [Deinococcus maricopensis]ADV68525.1 Cupin 2 conserved barrel domain protein [Deinococcus maricopensis DSM 21211]
MIPPVVNLEAAFARITQPWTPVIAGELNGQHVKLAVFRGAFVWHAHAEEDELFLVVRGMLRLRLEEGERVVRAGEFVVVPRGVRHCPVAEDGDAWVMLFEPASTVNTGADVNERTLTQLERLDSPPT